MCDRNIQMHATLRAVFDFIAAYIDKHGFAPSQREIATHCYMSPSSVPRYLDKLAAQGLILREEGQARSIKLLQARYRENRGEP